MSDEEMTTILKEIRDLHKQALDKQTQFLLFLVPIFAILCVQTVLVLVQ